MKRLSKSPFLLWKWGEHASGKGVDRRQGFQTATSAFADLCPKAFSTRRTRALASGRYRRESRGIRGNESSNSSSPTRCTRSCISTRGRPGQVEGRRHLLIGAALRSRRPRHRSSLVLGRGRPRNAALARHGHAGFLERASGRRDRGSDVAISLREGAVLCLPGRGCQAADRTRRAA